MSMNIHSNLKILVVSNTIPVTPDDPQHAFVRDQAVAIANLGVQVDLVVIRPLLWSFMPGSKWKNPDFGNRPDLEPLNSVIEIPILAVPGRVDLLAWVQAAKLQTRKYRYSLREKQFDAAIVHGEIMGAIFADTFENIDLPFIYVVHGGGDSKSSLNRRGQKVQSICASKASSIVMVGDGIDIPGWIKDRGKVIPNGLTIPRAIKKLEKPSGTLILSIGTLKSGKGIKSNLEAVSILRKKGFDVTYWIVGDGPLRNMLKKTAAHLGIANYTRFYGLIDRNEIGNYIDSCDIFSLPSYPEAFGLAHLEAASMRKPVIACVDTGPAFNLPNEVASLLVPPKDSKSVAEAWERLIENPSLSHKLGENASKIASQFSWDRNAIELVKIIESHGSSLDSFH